MLVKGVPGMSAVGNLEIIDCYKETTLWMFEATA